MIVDLRSDTVTRPTADMRAAMANAEVGDDEYGEDPTVNTLQDEFADVTGKEAALFVPSGTMANQIALRLLTRPGDAVVAGAHQHVVVYEAGAGPINSGVTFLTVDDHRGALEPSQVELAVESAKHHQPAVAAIAIEDSHMAAGGTVWTAAELHRICSIAARHRLPVHMDGARLWNASVATGTTLASRAAPATTVMCCLSKGLGAPVGSVLAGPVDLIEAAKLHRKRFGGTMRQAGIIAAAGLVGMRKRVERLAEDHARARRLAEVIAERWPRSGLVPETVVTNIVIFEHSRPDHLLDHLRREGVLAGTVAPGRVRLVTHADLDDGSIDRAVHALSTAP